MKEAFSPWCEATRRETALLRLNLNLASRTRANFQFQEIQVIEEQDNDTTRKLTHPECGTPRRTTDPVSETSQRPEKRRGREVGVAFDFET